MILLMEDSAGIFVVLYCHKRSIERFTYIIIVLYFLSISSIFQKFYLFFENYLHLQQKNHCFQRFRDIVLLSTVVMRFHSLVSSISVNTFHCICISPIACSNSSIVSALAAALNHPVSTSISLWSMTAFMRLSEGSPMSRRSSMTHPPP